MRFFLKQYFSSFLEMFVVKVHTLVNILIYSACACPVRCGLTVCYLPCIKNNKHFNRFI